MLGNIFTLLLSLGTISLSCGQYNHLSSRIRDQCDSIKITYLGVEIKYPLTVLEAKRIYNLQYKTNGYFFKTIDSLPKLGVYVPYNFKLIFVTEDFDFWKDVVPEEKYHNRLVKGYTFYLQGSVNFDSLKNSLEKRFVGDFIKKQAVIPSEFSGFGIPERFFYELKISDCVYVRIPDADRPGRLVNFVTFYFDMTEEERLRSF